MICEATQISLMKKLVFSTGKLSDDSSEDGTSMSTAPRHFRSKLEEALTAKQESEAKVTTLSEKVAQYEAEIIELKQRVWFRVFIPFGHLSVNDQDTGLVIWQTGFNSRDSQRSTKPILVAALLWGGQGKAVAMERR